MVFDSPVVTIMREEFSGGGLRLPETGDDIDLFAFDFAGGNFRTRARDTPPLF